MSPCSVTTRSTAPSRVAMAMAGRMRQDRRAQPFGGAGIGARQIARLQVQVGRGVPQGDCRFGVQKRRQAVRLGWRNGLNIQADRLPAFDLVVDLLGELRCARQLQAARLMKRQRLAGVFGELLDLGHAAHGQASHDRVGPDLLGQAGGARRRLGGDGVPLEQRDALARASPGGTRCWRRTPQRTADPDRVKLVQTTITTPERQRCGLASAVALRSGSARLVRTMQTRVLGSTGLMVAPCASVAPSSPT